jgi:hypothetical protein
VESRFELLNLGNVALASRDSHRDSEWRTITFSPSDTVAYLQDDAEGACYMRFEGIVMYDGNMCPVLFPEQFRLEGRPITQWWVRVFDGSVAGWVLVSPTSVGAGERTF